MFSGDVQPKQPTFMERLAKRLGIGTPKEKEVFCKVQVKPKRTKVDDAVIATQMLGLTKKGRRKKQ